MNAESITDLKKVELSNYGRDISNLFKAYSYGIDIEETLVVSKELFISYLDSNRENIQQIEYIGRKIEKKCRIHNYIEIYASFNCENFLFPKFEEVSVDAKIISEKILQIYNFWFEYKQVAHRLDYSITDEETFPAIYIQAFRKTHNLVSRCPITGEITNSANSNHAGNSTNRITKKHKEVMSQLECCIKYPVEFTFSNDESTLHVKRISKEAMTSKAALTALTEMFAQKIINTKEFIGVTEPEMIIKNIGYQIAETNEFVECISGEAAIGGLVIGSLLFDTSDFEKFDNSSIFCCDYFNPDGIEKLRKSRASFSMRGGRTSDLALVSLGWRKPCVVSAAYNIDRSNEVMVIGKNLYPEFSHVVVDGFRGKIFVSKFPLVIEGKYKAAASAECTKMAHTIVTSLCDMNLFKELSIEFQIKIATLLNAFSKIGYRNF